MFALECLLNGIALLSAQCCQCQSHHHIILFSFTTLDTVKSIDCWLFKKWLVGLMAIKSPKNAPLYVLLPSYASQANLQSRKNVTSNVTNYFLQGIIR